MNTELLDTRLASSFRQPCHALLTRAFVLEAAEQWALERAASVPSPRFRLASFRYIDFRIQHVPGERKAFYHGAARPVRELWTRVQSHLRDARCR
jgi:hypothetical protein